MNKTMPKKEQAPEQEKSSFMQWLTEDDAPEIGIASKEPVGDYFRGVRTEFNKIEWPNKEQVQNEFVTVIVIVAIISVIVYFIDIGLGNAVDAIRGI